MGVNTWLNVHSDALRAHIAAGRSFAVAAVEINRQFRTSYTRNAAIGRGQRMGLCAKVGAPARRNPSDSVRTRKPPSPPKIKLAPPMPARPPVEIIKLRCAAVEPLHVTLTDLQRGQCKYPYGERDYTFCGHSAIEGHSYCEPHFQLCTRDDPRKPANQNWLTAVRAANVPKAIALSSGDWEAP